MFNHGLKKQAEKIFSNSQERYDKSYDAMKTGCENLYGTRKNTMITIAEVTRIINTISSKPKNFETDFGGVGHAVDEFTEIEEYAEEEFKVAVMAGIGAATGSAAGASIASLGPNVLMSIATTFGKATTGRAISTLSGHAAKKAAIGWIGRTVAGFAVKHGSGYAVGKTVLALCGPIGWGISASSAGVAFVTLTKDNKKISDEIVSEAKKIEQAREVIEECTVSIDALTQKTKDVHESLHEQVKRLRSFEATDYTKLSDEDKYFLGTIVNNTLTLSRLLNEKIS